MSDDSFFREVDEELRSERMKDFWSRWGKLIIAAAVLLVAGVGANGFYDYYTKQQAAEKGDAFMEAVRLADQGKADEAMAALSKLEETAGGAYANLARLRAASDLAAKGDKQGAIAQYDEVIADASAEESLKAIARIRAGMLLVDTGTIEDVQQRVGSLAAPGGPWRFSAHEALGLAYYKAGDLDNAFKQFTAVSADENVPLSLRQRVRIMLQVIASNGGPVEAEDGN